MKVMYRFIVTDYTALYVICTLSVSLTLPLPTDNANASFMELKLFSKRGQ